MAKYHALYTRLKVYPETAQIPSRVCLYFQRDCTEHNEENTDEKKLIILS